MLLHSAVPDASAGTSPPTLPISQVPLTLAVPTHPQVLIAIGNSQSMDGDLSGAIMTGSGALSSDLSSLTQANSAGSSGSSGSAVNYCSPPAGFTPPASPINYCVPSGFAPPVQAADATGQAPYTVAQAGALLDNSASRLNVAKAGIAAILQAYMADTDFALEDYGTNGTALYTTWVYYMSPQSSGFSFTNAQAAGSRYVANPCYGYSTASSSVNGSCSGMAGLYGSTALSSNPYMQIGSSSDDASINDVLYASGLSGLCVVYGGPNPPTPYPPNFSLWSYEYGGVFIGYNSYSGGGCATVTGPTNAGYVPYSTQVMYAQRGFGYYVNGVSSNAGSLIVPMTTAGASPTISSVNTAIAAFTPYLAPENNNSSTAEIKALAYQSPLAGMMATAKTYMTSLPAGSGCRPQKYVILISDGLPTMDLSGAAWPPLGSAAAAGYGVTATFNSDGSLATTNDQALTDTINAIAALKAAGIGTFIVGLGAGVDPSLNPQAAQTLTAMAIAGGTGAYYAATSATALVNDLNDILIQVQAGSFSTTSAAVNSTQISSGSVTYQASFASDDSPYQDWTGNLVARTLAVTGPGTFTETQIWSAQGLLDSATPSNRIIATWNPALNSGNGGGAPFEWPSTSNPNTLSATQQAELQPSDSLGASRLLYLRGSTALERRNGGGFRNRSHILGDIVDSQPLYVGAPAGPYFTTSYFSFERSQATRQAAVYVGGDDGMLHAFNASTGAEMFAFVPNAVFANLVNLTAPLYNQGHRFFVDGSPNSGDVQFADGSWHTLVAGGENAGGNSIYALDVTNPASIGSESALASDVLWEFTDADMGLSYSQPQIGAIAVPPSGSAMQSYAVFFGNGYNSPNNNAVLYAVDPQTGTVIAKMNLCTAVPGACNTTVPQGLSTVAVANSDGLLGVPVTTVYAGDLQGNLWVINVTGTSASSWTARVLFKAVDGSGNAQPITTAPQVTLNPNYPFKPSLFVMFGTGRLLTNGDLSNTSTQSIYGVWDKPGSTSTFGRANLQMQTLTLISGATSGLSQSIMIDTGNSVNWNTQVGWYEDLPTGGQRVVVNPLLHNGSFEATLNTPPLNPCVGGFTAMFLDVNYQTGGAFAQPQLALSGNTISSLTYNNQQVNPVAVGLTPGFGTAGVNLTPSSTPGSGTGSGGYQVPSGDALVMFTDPNTGNHYWKLVPLNQVQRSSWWQIQ